MNIANISEETVGRVLQLAALKILQTVFLCLWPAFAVIVLALHTVKKVLSAAVQRSPKVETYGL